MKRYIVCLFLFVGVCAVCLAAGLRVARQRRVPETWPAEEPAEALTETAATETVPENRAAANQQLVSHTAAEEYYLVSEDGFLLVFGRDKETICLYTHIPLMDFPPAEQDRLREGIWFPGMMEVIQYLESYTS